MKVTEVKIRKTFTEGTLRALVSIVIDDSIAIHDIKIIQGLRLFLVFPSRVGPDDVKRSIVHPIDLTTRNEIESVVLQAYEHLKRD